MPDDRNMTDMVDEVLAQQATYRALRASGQRRLRVTKMWDPAAALDLQTKAEEYLLEYKPKGYERSAQAKAGVKHLPAWR